MIVLTCVDKNNGMMFNHRRQSQDSAVRSRIEKISKSGTLRMSPYSAKQWKNRLPKNAAISEDFLAEAADGDFCFVEDADIAPYEGDIEKLILFRWNRVYPEDQSLPINLHQWNLLDAQEFDGSSHRDITQEDFQKASMPAPAAVPGESHAREDPTNLLTQQSDDASQHSVAPKAEELSVPRELDKLVESASQQDSGGGLDNPEEK